MSMLNNEPMPTRADGESCADFYTRVNALLMKHYDGCVDCNYDHDCVACQCDDGSEPRTCHSCNCHDIKPPGYGIQLRQLVEAARRDRDEEARAL